jgi:hypothetical protein
MLRSPESKRCNWRQVRAILDRGKSCCQRCSSSTCVIGNTVDAEERRTSDVEDLYKQYSESEPRHNALQSTWAHLSAARISCVVTTGHNCVPGRSGSHRVHDDGSARYWHALCPQQDKVSGGAIVHQASHRTKVQEKLRWVMQQQGGANDAPMR